MKFLNYIQTDKVFLSCCHHFLLGADKYDGGANFFLFKEVIIQKKSVSLQANT